MSTSAFQQTPPELLQGLRTRDDRSISSLVKRFWGPMRSFVGARFPSLPGAEVDDVLQDTWIRLIGPDGAIDRFDASRGSFEAYLFLILRRTAIDRLRGRSGREHAHEALEPDHAHASLEDTSTRSPEADVMGRSVLQAILDCMQGGLVERDWLIFRLRYQEEADVDYIAQISGATPKRVYKRLEVIADQAQHCREVHSSDGSAGAGMGAPS